MSLKTHKFVRKPLYVDAVRVSEANMEEVAAWCKGKILEHERDGKYVSVEVYRPINDRQTQAFIGDWVLFAGSGYKVYTPKAFDKSFEKVRTLTKAQADEAGIKVPHEPRPKVENKGPVPTPPRRKQSQRPTTNVGEAVREAQKAKEAAVASTVADETAITLTRQPEKEMDEADKLIAEVLKHPRS